MFVFGLFEQSEITGIAEILGVVGAAMGGVENQWKDVVLRGFRFFDGEWCVHCYIKRKVRKVRKVFFMPAAL